MKHVLKGDFKTKDVWLDNIKIDPIISQKVCNHSQDGFNWGYSDGGSAQLSLAILLEISDKERAVENYQTFKQNVIALLPQENFETEFIWRL